LPFDSFLPFLEGSQAAIVAVILLHTRVGFSISYIRQKYMLFFGTYDIFIILFDILFDIFTPFCYDICVFTGGNA